MEVRVVLVALVYDIFVFLTCFATFLYFRRLRCDSLTKGARRRQLSGGGEELLVQGRVVAVCGSSNGSLRRHRQLLNTQDGPKVGGGGERDGLWTTYKALRGIPDEAYESLDIQFYLDFLKTLRQQFALMSVVALSAGLPVNLTAPVRNLATSTWISRSSVENITSDDWRMFFLLGLTVAYTFMAYWQIHKFWLNTRPLTVRMPPKAPGGDLFHPERFTIMVEGVDRSLTSAPTLVAQHFMALFPSTFLCARVVMNFEEHLRLLRKLRKARCNLRRTALPPLSGVENDPVLAVDQTRTLYPLLASTSDAGESLLPLPDAAAATIVALSKEEEFEAGPAEPVVQSRERPALWRNSHFIVNPSANGPANSPASGPANDAPNFPVVMSDNARDIWATTNDALDSLFKLAPSENVGIAFVSFRHIAAVQRCLDDPRVTGMWLDWYISPAPRPADILWCNIATSKMERNIRWMLANFLLVTASIVLTSSAVATNALIPLSEVMENAVREADFLRLSVTGWGAPLILFVVNSLVLPLLVWVAANNVRFWLQSRIDTFVLDGNVVFLTLNTVIFPTIGNGSLGALIAKFYHMEVQEWNVSLGLLVTSQSGSFALRYLLNACLVTPGVGLLQIGSMTWWGLMNSFGKTAEPSEFDFAYNYAFALAICFMVMSFGVVLPIVVPLGCFFYVMKYLVDKYNLTCGVLKARRDSGGVVAAIAARYMVGSVGLMQFLLSGYFIAHGINIIKGISVESLPSQVDLHKRLLHGRALVLGGTCLLLVSALTAVLLAGHAIFQLRTTPAATAEETDESAVPTRRERALMLAYAHPCEMLIETSTTSSSAAQRSITLKNGATAPDVKYNNELI